MKTSHLNLELRDVPLNKALKKAEAQVIEKAFQISRYNQSRTAKALGVSRGSLRMKLKEYFGDQYIV